MKRYGEHRFPGKLFVVEGIDGSGKSTQLMLLQICNGNSIGLTTSGVVIDYWLKTPISIAEQYANRSIRVVVVM